MARPAFDRAARTIVLAALRSLRGGDLTIREPGTTHRFGDGRPDRYGRPPLVATVTVRDAAVYERVLTHGSVGLGESYVDGLWDADDLAAALRILDRNVRRLDPVLRSLRRATAPVTDPVRYLRRQNLDRDRIDIQSHYDLGNAFFERLLDETMMYSAALFERPEQSLADASIAKLDRLCQRLDLGPGDHVLEIGTGWGGFAEHAASRYGCRVTTTTISSEQHHYAADRIAAAGLDHLVTVLDRDYRTLVDDGEVHRYDAIVSIEMIEAVDWREYDTFHDVCGRLLAPDGRLGMQAIVIPGQRYEQAKVRKDFIKSRIFPGGCLPSIEALLASSARVGDLTLTDLQDFGLHYAETLRRWRSNLAAARGDLDALGLDEQFARMWEFYLAYCEAGFDERDISVVQLVLSRPGHRPAAGDLSGRVAIDVSGRSGDVEVPAEIDDDRNLHAVA